MQLYEVEGKALLRDAGFSVPESRLVASEVAAVEAAFDLGIPVVLKAQTLSGGRGKGGLVAIVRDDRKLGPTARRLLAASPYLLIERYVPAEAECYAAVTIAEARGEPLLLLSARGGVDVERDAAAEMLHWPFAPDRPPWTHELLDGLRAHGLAGPRALALARAGSKLARFAVRAQCTLAEINPLFIVAGERVVAGDAKIELDDESSEPFVPTIPREEDPLERRAAEEGMSFTRLDGDVGVMAGGAGLAMLVVDALVDAGLRPANFMDLQGSSARKLTTALEIVGSIPDLRGIMVNNAGGLSSCTSLAPGIVEGAKRVRPGVQIVVKLRGAQQDEAWALLAESPNVHVATTGTTGDAVRLMAACLADRQVTADVD